MTEASRTKGRKFAEFLNTLTPEQIAHGNALSRQQAEAEFRSFNEHFDAGNCYLCRRPLTSFSKKLPCPHWLMKPKGFKKNDLPAIANLYGFYQIQSFLRWVANREAFAKNINDLEAEGTGKLFEATIRWKNLEWAFSCGESDYQGHTTSQHSKDETVDFIVNSSEPSSEESDGAFKLDTIAMAEEGKTISGDDLYEIIQEAKTRGVTAASLMHKLPNARTQVIVTPGPGVVEQAPRSGRKGDAPCAAPGDS